MTAPARLKQLIQPKHGHNRASLRWKEKTVRRGPDGFGHLVKRTLRRACLPNRFLSRLIRRVKPVGPATHRTTPRAPRTTPEVSNPRAPNGSVFCSSAARRDFEVSTQRTSPLRSSETTYRVAREARVHPKTNSYAPRAGKRLRSGSPHGEHTADGGMTDRLSCRLAPNERAIATSKFRDKRRANRLAMTITLRRRRTAFGHQVRTTDHRRRLETPWVGIHVSSTREYRDSVTRFQGEDLGHLPEIFAAIKAARRKPSGDVARRIFGSRRAESGGLAPCRYKKNRAVC